MAYCPTPLPHRTKQYPQECKLFDLYIFEIRKEMASDLEVSFFGPYLTLITWTNVLLVLNTVCGIALFEWAWYKARRFRHPIEELDKQFPELRRFDGPKWKKWKLYPGAAFLLMPRIILCVLGIVIMVILVNIVMIGHDRKKPLGSCRGFLSRIILKLGSHLFSIVGYFTFIGYEYKTLEDVNFYEEYLGSFDE